MKAARIAGISLFLLCVSPCCLLAAEPFSAGSAKSEITPVSGTPLAGYGKRHGRPSKGAHDPLYARALALSKDGQTFIFVSADLVLIDRKLREEALEKINRAHPLPASHFLLTATHTHSGSGAIGKRLWQRFIMGKYDSKVFEQVTSGIARAAEEALKNQQPAQAFYGETRIDGLIENRMDEKKSGPHYLRLLKFKNKENKELGAFIFMAAHPTLLPASNDFFSADFPGVMTRELDKRSGAVHVFINGAGGDLRPRAPAIEDRFEKMEAYGKILVEESENLSFEEVALDGIWQGVLEKKKLSRVKARAGFFRFPSLIGGRVFPRHSYFHGIRLGKTLLLSFPGELASDLGASIERQARAFGFQPFIAGYAQDYIGYVIPNSFYRDSDQYESRASFYGPRMDWFTEAAIRDITLKLLTPEEKKLSEIPGKLENKNGLPVLLLRGDAYHTGFEEGRLLKKEIRQGYDDIFSYFRKQLVVPLLNRAAISFLGNRAWKQLAPYVSYEEHLQMKGLADGSGISLKKIRQIHALPEIYPALCSNGAYWGEATAGGRLIAIRNLDWNRGMGIHRHAAVKWIETPGQNSYANIGYYGFTGVLSGINENGLSVGQIGATSEDETMRGTPMPFLLRRVLAQAGNLEDAEKILRENFRTRGYHYLFSDGKEKRAIILETTAHRVAKFSDDDPEEKKVSYATPLKNAVFRGDPALDPGIRDLQTASFGDPRKPGLEVPQGSAYEIRYLKHGTLIREHYGKITPAIAETIARDIAPGSNIQSVIYAYPEFFIANAEDEKRAVDTGYVTFNLEDLKRKSAA